MESTDVIRYYFKGEEIAVVESTMVPRQGETVILDDHYLVREVIYSFGVSSKGNRDRYANAFLAKTTTIVPEPLEDSS